MKKSFWDVLAWLAFAYVVIYLLLKAAGVLNSPLAVDVAAIASGAFFVGKYFQKIDFCSREIEYVKTELRETNRELYQIDKMSEFSISL